MAVPAALEEDAAAPSRWRPTPAQLVRLLIGLVAFGGGEALIVRSALGNTPWTVLAQGVSRQTGVAIGTTTIVLSFLILLGWIPLRQRPGLGTVANAVVVGLTIDVVLALLGDGQDGSLARTLELAGGIALISVGSGLYLTARLGPGPRDGLMTGLSLRTLRSLRLTRAGIELAACAIGVVLGGTIGVGTLAFALLIGPGVQTALAWLGTRGAEGL